MLSLFFCLTWKPGHYTKHWYGKSRWIARGILKIPTSRVTSLEVTHLMVKHWEHLLTITMKKTSMPWPHRNKQQIKISHPSHLRLLNPLGWCDCMQFRWVVLDCRVNISLMTAFFRYHIFNCSYPKCQFFSSSAQTSKLGVHNFRTTTSWFVFSPVTGEPLAWLWVRSAFNHF